MWCSSSLTSFLPVPSPLGRPAAKHAAVHMPAFDGFCTAMATLFSYVPHRSHWGVGPRQKLMPLFNAYQNSSRDVEVFGAQLDIGDTGFSPHHGKRENYVFLDQQCDHRYQIHTAGFSYSAGGAAFFKLSPCICWELLGAVVGLCGGCGGAPPRSAARAVRLGVRGCGVAPGWMWTLPEWLLPSWRGPLAGFTAGGMRGWQEEVSAWRRRSTSIHVRAAPLCSTTCTADIKSEFF